MNTPSNDTPSQDGPSRARRYIVGIGASAGGLEALELLFAAMPLETGMAFVVVLHLSPDFESHMEELLSRKTTIPVHSVTEGTLVQPDNVYIIPPKKEMVVTDGRLRLTARSVERVLTHPVDQFFRSLANDAGGRAIGIVLSGTGSDGSRGVREISEAGGLVLCQDERSARFDGMPLNAQATGTVDIVCPPASMPAILQRYARDNLTPEMLAGENALDEHGEDDGLGQVFRVLRRASGVDFGHYKAATIGRRVNRRMVVHGLPDVAAYARHVDEHPEEVEELYKDLLIGVTRFFRDAEAFAHIDEDVIPKLVAPQRNRRDVRLWIAGCASGEEVYSLAILFDEHIRRSGADIELKIFATDIHEGSLEFAARGLYPAASMREMTAERRERYFTERGDGFQVSPGLRKTVVFSSHNVFNDAPFTQLDMVSCRNLLIYLRPLAQKKALSLFHFALKTGGCLFLGPSETPGEIDDEFETIDTRWRIYRKRRDIRLPFDSRVPMATTRSSMPRGAMAGMAGKGGSSGGAIGASGGRPSRTTGDASLLAMYDRLLELHMPASFLVAEDHSLLHTFGGAERHMRSRGGRHSSNLLDIVDERLKTPLSNALQHARRDGGEVRYSGLRLGPGEGDAEEEEVLELHVRAMTDPLTGITNLLVRLVPAAATAGAAAPDARAPAIDLEQLASAHIDALEEDLRYTRENLQATIEELETSNEELQAANEEMLASNEELQSTNEELQSVNEELFTINSEHQSKIEDLVRANDDMDNLLDITQVGVVFLDDALRVRRYTPEIGRLFDMRPQDVGRSIEHFEGRVTGVDLVAELADVVERRVQREHAVTTRDGRGYLMRLAPYRRSDSMSGAALTLVDVEELAEAQRDTRRFKLMSDQAVVGQVLLDRAGHYVHSNAAYAELAGRTVDELLLSDVGDVDTQYDALRFRSLFDELREVQLPAFESELRRADGVLVPIEVTANTVNLDGRILMYATVTGIAARVEAREALASAQTAADSANRAKSEFLANMSHEIRTPLTAIMGMTDLMRTTLADAEHIGYADGVKRNAYHLLDIVNDILDLSKIEADQLRFEHEPVSVAALVSDVYSMCAVRAAEKGLELAVHCDTPVPVTIDSDIVRLRQILLNLLGNAIKFTQKGGITIRLALRGDALRIGVIDTGVGFDATEAESLFEPFKQSDATILDRHGGTGLGLSISRRLAQRLGGRIDVHSESGVGSEFHVELPVTPDNLATLIERIDLSTAPLPTSLPGSLPGSLDTPPTLRGHVLVAEDRPDVLSIVQAMLRNAGATVSTAVDGAMAVELVRRSPERYDLLVLDIQMPIKTGLEAVAELRAEGYARPIVALTAQAMKGERERCVEAGFDDFVAKPIDAPTLLGTIARLLPVPPPSPLPSTPSSPTGTGTGTDPLGSTSVLVVEDHDATRLVVGKLLERVGCTVRGAGTGADALAAVADFVPDVALLDMRLPDMNGLELHARLRSDARLDDTAFIALTGDTDEDTLARIEAAGFRQRLVKPVGAAELTRAVRDALETAAVPAGHPA